MPALVAVYTPDCVVRGRIAQLDGRLTDRLNELGEIDLVDATVEALDDGRLLAVDEVSIPIDEIDVLDLGDTRGSGDRRIRTSRHRLAFEIGPYRLTGDLHTLATLQPLAALDRRPAIVPLTAVVMEYRVGDERVVLERDVMGVNQRASHVRLAHEADDHLDAPGDDLAGPPLDPAASVA